MTKLAIAIALCGLVIGVPAAAQEIEYDPALVGKLSANERAQIASIMKANRLVADDARLESAQDLEDRLKLPKIKIRLPDPRKDLCKAACDISAASAIAGCSGLSGGAAIAVCTAAAVAARDACKKGC